MRVLSASVRRGEEGVLCFLFCLVLLGAFLSLNK